MHKSFSKLFVENTPLSLDIKNSSPIGRVYTFFQKQKSKTSVRPSPGSRQKLKSVRGGSSDKNGSLLVKAESASVTLLLC